MEAHLQKMLAAAETATAGASERFETRMTEAIATAEATLSKLVEQVEASRAAATQAGQQVMAYQKDTLAGAGAAGSVMLDGLAEARQRITDFVAERIRQDIEVHSEMLGCRSFDEMREVQSRFFRAAMDQYAAEASHMMKLGSDALSRALSSVKH
jgi:hypothetical protein